MIECCSSDLNGLFKLLRGYLSKLMGNMSFLLARLEFYMLITGTNTNTSVATFIFSYQYFQCSIFQFNSKARLNRPCFPEGLLNAFDELLNHPSIRFLATDPGRCASATGYFRCHFLQLPPAFPGRSLLPVEH